MVEDKPREIKKLMADLIPNGIQREHILTAIDRYDSGAEHQFADSTIYDILHNGRRYPPKAIIGIAAGVLTGSQLGPDDFKGGQKSKCFRVLQANGFQIVPKLDAETKAAWIFQGNPKRFDIDDYLSRYSYIYWSAPRYQADLQVGEPCMIWRSGASAGAIAIGRIAEAPQPITSVNFADCLGEDLWRSEDDSPSTVKVGIEINDVRLDEEAGYIPRNVFLDNPVLADTHIIKSPQGTVFKLKKNEARESFSIWNAPLDFTPSALPAALEGVQRLRKHYARERSRNLINKKKEVFAQTHDSRVFCELCGFDFSINYPTSLGDGFIEVHHLTPLFAQEQPRRTTLDDLLLVCSNCHRMIHRSKDVDENLRLLREHFMEEDNRLADH